MHDRLVILGSSDRPDVYFNIITVCARAGTKKFVVALIGEDGQVDLSDRAQNLNENLTALVSGLRRGDYVTVKPGDGVQSIPLDDPEPAKDSVAQVRWGEVEFIAVPESTLEQFLRQQVAESAAFDVTACKNSALAGAVAWLVSRGGSTIYSFEQLVPPTYGPGDLLPFLGSNDFRYRDLSQGQLVRRATRRVNIGTLSKRTFWLACIATALAVAAITALIPDISNPILAAAATFATIMSAVALFVRSPDT